MSESKIPLPRPAQQTTSSRTTQTTPSSTLPLLNVMQNFVLHLFVANHSPTKVYDKISHYGPRNTSTKFMATTVRATERYLTVNCKRVQPRKDEAIWKATQIPRQGKKSTNVTQSQPPSPVKPPYRSTNEQQTKTTTSCYKCDEDGHFKRDCNKCGHCRIARHSEKNCRCRIRKLAANIANIVR